HGKFPEPEIGINAAGDDRELETIVDRLDLIGILLGHLFDDPGHPPGIPVLEFEFIELTQEEHVVIEPFNRNIEEFLFKFTPPVPGCLLDPDTEKLALAGEPVDRLLDHEPEDLVDPRIFGNFEILQPVYRRVEPDKFDHLLPCGKRHILESLVFPAPLYSALLGGKDEIAVRDRRADDDVHGPVLLELLGTLCIFPGVDHLHAKEDIVNCTIPAPPLVAHCVIEEFFDKGDLFGPFRGFKNGKGHRIDELVEELIAEAGKRLIKGGDDLTEKNGDICVNLFAIDVDIFVK